MTRVTCVGHAALDHVFEIDSHPSEPTKTLAHRFELRAGGMSLHAAIAAARLGASVRLLGPEIVLVTLGPEGARWLDARGTAQQVRVPQVQARDTTGAGDVFHAALALALAQGRATQDFVGWACAAAAYKCERGCGAEGAPMQSRLAAWVRGRS
jgi:sulfofructose kinase